MNEKRCNNCINALAVDNGLKNHMVMGTDIVCMKLLKTSEVIVESYSEYEEMAYAEKCPEFTPGGPGITIDAEKKNVASLTAEEIHLLKDYRIKRNSLPSNQEYFTYSFIEDL